MAGVAAAALATAMVPGMALAVDGTAAEPGEGTTQVEYKVDEGFAWSIPTEIDFTNAPNATVTTSGDSGTTQNVRVTKNIIKNNEQLKIAIKGTMNGFKVKSAEGATLPYSVSVNGTDLSTSADKTVLAVDAGTNAGETPLTFKLTKDSTEKAGTYGDTVTFAASVVKKSAE